MAITTTVTPRAQHDKSGKEHVVDLTDCVECPGAPGCGAGDTYKNISCHEIALTLQYGIKDCLHLCDGYTDRPVLGAAPLQRAEGGRACCAAAGGAASRGRRSCPRDRSGRLNRAFAACFATNAPQAAAVQRFCGGL